MKTLSSRGFLVATVALLALTAGCQSFAGNTTPGATPTATEQSSATTPTSGVEPTPQSRTSPAFLDTHQQRLRSAGSVTFVSWSAQNQTAAAGSNLPSFNRTQTLRLEVDFTRGSALQSFDPLVGEATVTYRNERGASFAKSGEQYYRPGQRSGIDVDGASSLLYPNGTELENRGAGTVDGVTGTVYSVESIDAVDPVAYQRLNGDNVSSFDLTYVVDDQGFAAYQRLRLTYDYEQGTVTRVWTVRATDVGTTTVDPPEWLEEARAATDDR